MKASEYDAQLPKYDLEKVYDEQISPLMTKIIEICQEHRIPMVASFQYANSETEGPAFCTTIMVGGPNTQEVRYPAASNLLKAAAILKPKKPFVAAFAEWESTAENGEKTIHIKRLI